MQGPAQENLKNESKTHPNTKVRLVSKSTIWHFWSANRHFQSAEWLPFELWPNSLRVLIRHILFEFFAKRHVSIHILPIVAYFLSIPASINRGWISKIQHTLLRSKSTLFDALGETPFHTLKFLTPFLVFSLKLGFLGFKDNCINFFEL